jgi:hypothetical protein
MGVSSLLEAFEQPSRAHFSAGAVLGGELGMLGLEPKELPHEQVVVGIAYLGFIGTEIELVVPCNLLA